MDAKAGTFAVSCFTVVGRLCIVVTVFGRITLVISVLMLLGATVSPSPVIADRSRVALGAVLSAWFTHVGILVVARVAAQPVLKYSWLAQERSSAPKLTEHLVK